MRINSDPPETLSWTVGTNSKALFVSSASDFMKLLPDDGKLFLRATGFQGRQADGTFNLADISSERVNPSRLSPDVVLHHLSVFFCQIARYVFQMPVNQRLPFTPPNTFCPFLA